LLCAAGPGQDLAEIHVRSRPVLRRRLAIRLKETLKNAEVLHNYWDGRVFNDAKVFADVERTIQVVLKHKNAEPTKAHWPRQITSPGPTTA
jgi:hypothetical protein